MGASFVRHPAASSHGQNRTGREDGGNGKCGGSAPQGWKPYLSLGSAATGPPACRSVRFDQAANGCGVMNEGCPGRWSGGKPDRAAFVAKRRIPEGGVSTWCTRSGPRASTSPTVTRRAETWAAARQCDRGATGSAGDGKRHIRSQGGQGVRTRGGPLAGRVGRRSRSPQAGGRCPNTTYQSSGS